MAANVQSMAYFGEVPWHGLGTAIDHAMTWEEMLAASGLNFDVALREAFYFSPQRDKHYRIPDGFAVVRTDNGTPLGLVGKNYRTVQNSDAALMFDAVVKQGEGVYHTAGVLGVGDRVWILAKLPDMIINGEKHNGYLLFTSGHDGKHAVEIAVVFVRVVCNNTLNTALMSVKGSQHHLSIRHTSNAQDRLKEATRVMGIARQSFEDYRIKGASFMSRILDASEERLFVESLFKKPEGATTKRIEAQVEESRRIVGEMIVKDMVSVGNTRPTAWNALNGVTAMVDHVLVGRSRNALVYSQEGQGYALKAKAVGLLDEMIAA